MDYISEINIQYVDLGGVPGVFLKLDAALIDEHSLEALLHSAQQQIRLMVRASREGSTVHRETYSKSTERIKRSKLCHCRYCDEIYYCRSDLVAHQTRIHPNLPLRVGKKARKPCPSCGRLVLNLALHIRTKHQGDPVVNFTTGLAQCRQCEETYPVNSYSEHAEVCRFSPTCPDCKKTFSQWRVMNKHRKIVHQGEKLTCSTCNKTYHDAQSLKKHVEAVHLKLKRVCPLCGATVTTLAGHMNAVHAGNRNFPCTSCDKKFKSNYDLTRHRASVHLGQKPACPICGKHLSNLDQHIRIVHKQIKFSCNLCSKQLNTRSDLQKHITKVHGEHVSKIHGDHMLKVHAGDLGNNQFKFISQDMRGVVGGAQVVVDQETLYTSHGRDLSDEHGGGRDLSEEQLIAQYLGKQTFNLPSTPLKQEVLNDPMILCKEEQQLLSKQDLELLGQTRINVDPRQQQQDIRDQDIRGQEQQHRHTDMRSHEMREEIRGDLRPQEMRGDLRSQEMRHQDMRLADIRQQLELPRQHSSLNRTIGLDRLELETERHLTRIDLDTERHLSRMVDLEEQRQQRVELEDQRQQRVDLDGGDRSHELLRLQQNTNQLRQMHQIDDKMGSDMDGTINRSYQSPLLSTVHGVHNLHTVHSVHPSTHSLHSNVNNPHGSLHPLPPWNQHLNQHK